MHANAGTPQFLAFEQSGMEDSKVTTAVDIYGFAGVAIDCLTGLFTCLLLCRSLLFILVDMSM